MNKASIQDGKRIALTEQVGALLEAEVKRLKEKGPYFKVNEARLANVIIEIFCSQFLVKSQKQIEARFFDKKSYLKTLIQNAASEDALSESLNEFVHQNKVKKLKAPKASKNGPSEVIE